MVIKGPQRKVNVQHVRSPLCVCWTQNGHDGINVTMTRTDLFAVATSIWKICE